MSDPSAKPPTILVIDDDAEIRYSLARVLSSRKYQVIEICRYYRMPELRFPKVQFFPLSYFNYSTKKFQFVFKHQCIFF